MTSGGELTTLPCDRDSRWIIDWLDGLRDRACFELLLDGDSSDYRKMPVYRRRKGARLTPADVALGRADEVAAMLAARRQLGAVSLPPLQVSMPAPLDLCLFAFGVPAVEMGRLPAGRALRAVGAALRYLPVFEAAIRTEIEQIQKLADGAGEEMVIQLESPAVMVAYDRAPRVLWPMVTWWLAGRSAAIVAAAPPYTRFIFHKWCHGDLGHKPITRLRNLGPLVAFSNAVARRLVRAGRALPALHVALCDGETPPSVDAADFVPLAKLDAGFELIAGLVDERHPESSRVALQLTEQTIGRPVHAVAAGCGLGRRTEAEAEANIALAIRLIEAEFPPVNSPSTDRPA